MPKQQFRTVFIFLDTDEHVSPFDILTVIDTLPEATVLQYSSVTQESARQIIQDAIFPRGPEGAKSTKLFINGRDFELVDSIVEETRKVMFSPFEVSVIVDPRGAYTTAAAAVARTKELLTKRFSSQLEGKKVVILAGTGPVGQTAARLFAQEEAKVTITSRSLEKAAALAEKINHAYPTNAVASAQVKTPEETAMVLEDASVILAAGASGTELLPRTLLREHCKKCKIVVDLNAIPPLGVEGLAPEDDAKEIENRTLGIGALAIGKIKNKIEIALIRKVAAEPKGIFDYRDAYIIAKEILANAANKTGQKVRETLKYWSP